MDLSIGLPSATAGCPRLGFEAQPAEPIPHHLSRTLLEIALRSSKVQVIKEVCSDEAHLDSTRWVCGDQTRLWLR